MRLHIFWRSEATTASPTLLGALSFLCGANNPYIIKAPFKTDIGMERGLSRRLRASPFLLAYLNVRECVVSRERDELEDMVEKSNLDILAARETKKQS